MGRTRPGYLSSLTRIAILVFPLLPAGHTTPLVHIDRPPTGWAGPALPLGFHKIPYPILPDYCKVPDHTHVVTGPVPLIELCDPAASILRTEMTVSPAPLFAGEDGTVPSLNPLW